MPDEIEERKIPAGAYPLAELLVDMRLAASKKEAKRLIEQGGVKLNGEKATAANAEVEIDSGGVLIQVGKLKFLKITA
jgi:tyrosyl-tRNA synthetase